MCRPLPPCSARKPYPLPNLAEGFMLISEQEKSGKVERRKDMQTMTSAYANKMLKSLEEDIFYAGVQ